MATVSLTVNGAAHTVDVDPATPLLYVLRNDLNLQGPRSGGALLRPPGVPRAGREHHHARRAGAERQAAPGAAGVDRRAGAGVRLLPERSDPYGHGASDQDAEPNRRADPAGHG